MEEVTSYNLTSSAHGTLNEIRVSRMEAWLNSAGKNPGEQALKIRLKGVLELAL